MSRTLEYGSCNENAVGCLPYVTEKKAGTEEWKGTKDSIVGDKLSGAMQVLYLNDRITNRENTCPDTADGCTKFVGAERNSMTGAYIQDPAKAYIQDTTRLRSLKKAPNYLGCYDTTFTENSPEVNFPTTPLEIAVLTDDPRCDAYASVCLPEEVGCEAYTPAGGGEAVPGVVGDNFCPAACVGYDTFRQEKTNFESSEYPLYFIPANGTECSAQHVGCDEFTNIDDVSQGGEQLEYYSYIKQCEEPTGDNRSVYYSWEGSESTGFVLRVHTLAKVGSDYEFIPSSLQADFPPESPAYADDSSANLLENDGLCNETLYTNVLSGVPDAPRAFADCRALYDAKGVAYYRLLAETVTVSSACHPIRKTASRLVVSDDITSANTCLRKNGYWDGSSCQVCFGGGNWVAQDGNATQGSCVYYAIDAPGESVSCPASANECRAYTGNAGNNVRPVFESGTDTFEPLGDDADSLSQAKSAWSPADQVSIAAEALQVTFNSLRVNGGAAANSISRSLPAGAFESNTAYQLTFWARGTAQTLSISLQQGDDTRSLTTDPVTNTNLPISISQTWRAYTVGPVIFTGDATAPLDLVFQRAGASNGIYFLDNVSLLRTDENTNRIKNSWKTVEGYDAPAECFADSQNPRGPFPGAALGCQEYTTSLGQTVYATGFERLCREKAVGCAPLWDTFNSDSTEAEVYNARCISGTLTQTRYSRNPVTAATTCTITVESSEYTCSIAAGESSCVIPGPIRLSSDELITPLSAPGTGILVIKEGSASALHFDNPSFFAIVDKSSVYIPADTPFESPVFLTDTPEYICADKYLGCRVTGLEEQHTPDNASAVSYSYTDQGVINLPSTYLGDQGILCVQDQVACSAFTTSDGSTSYFKDPAVNANKLCVYQAPQTNNVDAPEGWFLKSVGHCSQDDAILCDSNAACGEGNTCVEIGESEPCYPTYQTNLESYGLWSNGSQQYSGYVGECPATQNLCTELVDPYDVDTSGKNPDGKPYYVIYDDQVTKNADECGGQASLREGCALFDNTEVPTKSYDTDATYGSSEQRAAKGDINTLVATVSTDKNDANVLLKVQRNRECSEWLACESYEPIQTGDGKQIFACESFARCIAFDGVGCSSWATDNGSTKPSNTFLNLDVYISRDTSWNGAEYTGYSLYNRFGLGDLKIIKFSQSERFSNAGVDADNGYLGYVLSDTYLTDNQGDTCLNATVGDVCGINGEGRCINTQCVVPADGAFDAKDTTLSNIATALGVAECKVPPEQDSPFSFDVIPLIENRDKHGFANNNVTTDLVRYTFSHRPAEVNVCQSGDCTCNYVAVSYGSLVKDYWASDTYHKKSSDISLWGICTGASETEGDYCREDNDCSFGTCQKIDRIETQIGSTGHCLEYDFSRKIFSPSSEPRYACLTWYPSDKSFGNVDTRNLFSAAGYDPAIDASTSSGDTGGQVYCTNSFGRSAGAYEGDGNLLIHQLYGGGSMKNAPGLPIAAYAYDSQSCAPLTIGPNSDNPFFKQKADGSIYLPESWSQVVGCSIDWFSKINTNPFAGYVCGALYAHSYSRSGNIDPSCGLTTIPEYTRKDSLNFLYNLMSGFGWEFIDKNAVVLRVEGDTSSEYSTTGGHHFGYWGKEDTYLVNALVPSMSIIAQMRDTQTLMHPPRFELTDGTFSFDNAVPVGTGGNFIGVKTDTLCLRAGGCPFYEDWPTLATETEGYLNIQALNSVYFIPLRSTAPYSSPVIFQPAILSKDLKIDFRGQLGTKPEVSILSAPDMVGIPVGPDATTKSTKTAVTSYKLERDTASNIPCDGLVSFCSYSGGSDLGQGEKYTYTPSNTANTDDAVAFIQSKRNEVATRYVVVYYPQEQNLLPSFVKNSPSEKFTKPTSIETDPFSAQCVFAVGSTVKTDYFAIGMDFNKDGEFLGYISRNCGYYGMQMAVIATMKDQCSEFVSVYRNVDPTTESNKAWTNRVWKGTQYTLKASYTAQVSQDAQHPPFGSSPFTEQDITTDGADYRAQAALLASVFTNSKFGYPFFCYPGNIASRSVFGDTSRCASLVDDGFDANTVEAFSVFSNKVMGGGYFDGPFIHPFNGEELLSRLFAKYYVKNVFPFDTAVSLDSQHGDLYYTDPDMIEGAHLQYPQIYSLNPITCFPRESAINCSVAKENAFSIGEADNEQYIGKGTYSAKARFFAFADDNRMPIRRVMIDWDDGDTTNKGVFGMYKNKKPYCEPSDTPPTETSLGYCRNQATREFTLVTCQQDLDCPTDGEYHCLHTWSNTPEDVQYGIDEQVGGAEFVAPRFGNMPRACDAKPFEYYHAYGCDNPTQTISMVRDQLTDITYNKLIESGLNDGSKICVYQPKVQVLDNWGYCNGSCNGAGNTGCYNDDGIGGILECDAPDYSTLHWTPYQGIIVIIP
ncbi:MAG: hypothetical protein COX83_00960 [Candidatus Magasanikbacteria bacterium CG_4_10_14_0_2_um_filter_41_31]|uniref:CBM-cenC domain-containing protein n=1 Tax=Candidatus Magasanikbacteria bacterium CG_4_10_14_0_2_um_filter_41_31 TaxID=1974639 RepID=A0A2M7V5B8_9BACT|nr:MAG: hypothetical protein COX83_00960 [Candidatus Magasanikbacteria bacterium CG_4_10_14_0_2_um_filter_41_31]